MVLFWREELKEIMANKFIMNILLVLLVVKSSHQVLEWMDEHVEKVKDWTVTKCMDNKLPFSHRQRNYCKKNVGYMEFISKSIRLIKHECRVAFVQEQWNCDVILNAPNFDRSIDDPTRESAAVQALAAAQILHSSITDCSYKGLCPKCKDRREVVPSHTKKAKGEEQLEEIIHQSGACEEMFPRPMDFIKRFLKIGKKKMQHLKKTWPEKRGHEEINFHNKQVGMQVAYKTRSPRCYCPGIFPICYTKICYTAMDLFWKVGREIRELYHKARKVEITSKGRLMPIDDPDRPISKTELIYAEDFSVCETREGTVDRVCSIDAAMKKKLHTPYCKDLCCGSDNWRKRPSKFIWECNCKFKWCCEVKCDTCYEDQFRYTCTK